MDNSELGSPLPLRGQTLKNRFIMAPMCQYSAVDGQVGPWHLRHYTERAIGGAALIITEATAVQPRGRISPGDLGIWDDSQVSGLRDLTRNIHEFGALAAVQLAHAGRKASTKVPWTGSGALGSSEGGWQVVAPTAEPFDPDSPVPRALDEAGIQEVIASFSTAATRAGRAGFDAVEIHGAHGYLLHQFLSPLVNQRQDRWGGTQENRFRLVVEITRAIRGVVPRDFPVLIRLSATDWVEGGWDIDQTVALLKVLKEEGIDFADISSGGLIPGVKIPVGPGYQVPLAAQVKKETGLPTGTVGLITEAAQAASILAAGQADAILLGRLLLRDPYFPLRNLPAEGRSVPVQYKRAF